MPGDRQAPTLSCLSHFREAVVKITRGRQAEPPCCKRSLQRIGTAEPELEGTSLILLRTLRKALQQVGDPAKASAMQTYMKSVMPWKHGGD